MKKLLFTLLAASLTVCGTSCLAQSNIPYGSNNGKYQEVNGTRLYYEEYGQGTPLLLIHGGFSSMADLATVIPALSGKFRVIAVDCPGQGRSEQADSLSYQLMADHFSKMIDLLKLDSVYVLGYSDGGNVALLMAADRPDKVKKAAAFAAASHTDGYYQEMIAGLDQLTPAVVEKDYRWWLDVHLQKTPQKDKWQEFIRDFRVMCATPLIIPEQKLEKISNSVLILQADKDIVKPEHALKLHQQIKSSQLCIIPGATHFVLLEKPEFFNQVVTDYFTKEPKPFDWTQLGN